MSILNLVKNFFGWKDKKTSDNLVKPILSGKCTSSEGQEKEIPDSQRHKLTLRGEDLMQMTRKLVDKGEYLRAEQLIRDGVKDLSDQKKIWELLLEIEEPLKRLGRVYFCVEKLLLHDPENEELQNKLNDLKEVIDKQLNHFIEYKLAPEFYKLR